MEKQPNSSKEFSMAEQQAKFMKGVQEKANADNPDMPDLKLIQGGKSSEIKTGDRKPEFKAASEKGEKFGEPKKGETIFFAPDRGNKSGQESAKFAKQAA